MTRYPAFDGTQNCASTPTDSWFQDESDNTYQDIHTIRRICGTCGFLEPCREYALHHAVHGIWGGTTEYERRRLRQKRNIIPINLESRTS